MPALSFGVLPLVACLVSAAAQADVLPPACGPEHDGVQICMSQQVCRCGHDTGGALTGRGPAWRWSCDIMQTCEMDVPADLGPPQSAGALGPIYVTPNITPPAGSAPQSGAMPPGTMPPQGISSPWRRP